MYANTLILAQISQELRCKKRRQRSEIYRGAPTRYEDCLSRQSPRVVCISPSLGVGRRRTVFQAFQRPCPGARRLEELYPCCMSEQNTFCAEVQISSRPYAELTGPLNLRCTRPALAIILSHITTRRPLIHPSSSQSPSLHILPDSESHASRPRKGASPESPAIDAA